MPLKNRALSLFALYYCSADGCWHPKQSLRQRHISAFSYLASTVTSPCSPSSWLQIAPISYFVPHHPKHLFFSATRCLFTWAIPAFTKILLWQSSRDHKADLKLCAGEEQTQVGNWCKELYLLHMCFMKSTWKIEVTVCYKGTQLPSWQPTAEMALRGESR